MNGWMVQNDNGWCDVCCCCDVVDWRQFENEKAKMSIKLYLAMDTYIKQGMRGKIKTSVGKKGEHKNLQMVQFFHHL